MGINKMAKIRKGKKRNDRKERAKQKREPWL
jgi:hypothetical protein